MSAHLSAIRAAHRETPQQEADRLLAEDRERRVRRISELQAAGDKELRPVDSTAVVRGIAHALAIMCLLLLAGALIAHAFGAW